MTKKKKTKTKTVNQTKTSKRSLGDAQKNKQVNSLVAVDIKTHGDKNGGHYHVIMDNIDDNHVSIGLTSQKRKGKNGRKNYLMEKSPFNDGKQSYMRRQGIVAPRKEYYNPEKGTLTVNDYEVAKKFSVRAKEKYLEKKNKKK